MVAPHGGGLLRPVGVRCHLNCHACPATFRQETIRKRRRRWHGRSSPASRHQPGEQEERHQNQRFGFIVAPPLALGRVDNGIEEESVRVGFVAAHGEQPGDLSAPVHASEVHDQVDRQRDGFADAGVR